MNLIKICVYPDGSNYPFGETPSWASDDYEVRHTCVCERCGEELFVEYAKPFAHCDCGTTEWYL